MTTGRRKAVATIVLSMVVATATSCTSAPEPQVLSRPSFAVTSADIVLPGGRPYPVNFIFLAAEDDPIWTELTGVELPGDASVGPGQFDLIRGEGTDGFQLGNITFEVDVPPDGLSFESVGLVYEGSPEPVPVDIGSWTLSEAPPEEFATADTKAEVAAIAGCTRADLPVPATTVAVDAFRTGSTDVTADDIALSPEDGAISVVFSCTDDSDFYVISPTLDYTDSEGARRSARFAPIAIGFQDIDDADLQRIRGR
ncbi:hypothetical protein ACI2IP_05125 [Microbacterium sp. NPDC090218]